MIFRTILKLIYIVILYKEINVIRYIELLSMFGYTYYIPCTRGTRRGCRGQSPLQMQGGVCGEGSLPPPGTAAHPQHKQLNVRAGSCPNAHRDYSLTRLCLEGFLLSVLKDRANETGQPHSPGSGLQPKFFFF